MTESVIAAIQAIRRGEIVVVVDGRDPENEGDLVMAAEAATTESIAFFLEHTSGIICASAPDELLQSLRLPQMVDQNEDPHRTAFTVSVDLKIGTTTGISAADRALTLRALADENTDPADLARPGHVFPLRARTNGVVERAGHTEASTDLARLAGCRPVGVLSEVVSPDRRRMATAAELHDLASRHNLPIVAVAELVAYRFRNERFIVELSSAPIPTRYGNFMCHSFQSVVDGQIHLALVMGKPSGDTPVLTRVHSECMTGDVFGSTRCDCGPQLNESLRLIAEAGSGALVYLRGHEGRGIGIASKLQAYALQDQGLDTVDANVALGLPVDAREYGYAAQILRYLGIDRVALITNNPVKKEKLSDLGIEVAELVVMPAHVTENNLVYLQTKYQRMGHILTSPIPFRSAAASTSHERRLMPAAIP